MKADSRFWVVAVYSAKPSSGDPNADFRAAWKRVVLAGPDYRGVPNYDPYNITESVGSGRLKHVNRYRFANLQQALDGSTVLTLWPPVDMAKIHPNRDSEYWTRPGKK